MSEKYEMRCQDLQRVIESLKRGLQSVYERLDMTESNGNGKEDEDGGGSGGSGETLITESNLVHYLGLIEQKANAILAKYTAVRQHLMQAPSAGSGSSANANTIELTQSPSKSIVAVLGSGPKIPMGQDLVHINPPKLDDYQSDDEDADDDVEMRPLTRDELKSRTLNRLQRRGNNMVKK